MDKYLYNIPDSVSVVVQFPVSLAQSSLDIVATSSGPGSLGNGGGTSTEPAIRKKNVITLDVWRVLSTTHTGLQKHNHVSRDSTSP